MNHHDHVVNSSSTEEKKADMHKQDLHNPSYQPPTTKALEENQQFHKEAATELKDLEKEESNLISDTDSVKSEESKDERLFIRTVREIRKKFMQRKLIGSIYIFRSFGVVTTYMECVINEKDYEEAADMKIRESLDGISGSYLQAVTMTDSLLDSMERRAMKWNEVDFNSRVTISRGAKFSIGGPLMGLVGYTILMELSATIPTLVNSRKRYLATVKPTNYTSAITNLATGWVPSFNVFGSTSSSEPNENQTQTQTQTQLESQKAATPANQEKSSSSMTGWIPSFNLFGSSPSPRNQQAGNGDHKHVQSQEVEDLHHKKDSEQHSEGNKETLNSTIPPHETEKEAVKEKM